MGYFPTTCGLSGLPIEDEDPVRTYLTVRRLADPGLNGTVNNTSLAAPFTLGLRGEYSGYGYPILEDNYNKRIVGDRLRIDTFEYEPFEGYTKSEWDGFWSAMNRGDLLYEDGRYGIGLLMIREDVIRHLVDNPPEEYQPQADDKEFLESCYSSSSPDQDYAPTEGLLPSGIKPGTHLDFLKEQFPVEEVLYYDKPDFSDDDLEEFGIDPEGPLWDIHGGMYSGMEHHADGATPENRIQFTQDKVEFGLVYRWMLLAGRNWVSPPLGYRQFPDWKSLWEFHRGLTDVAAQKIGEDRYEADVTQQDLEGYLWLQEEMKRRLTKHLPEGAEMVEFRLENISEVRCVYTHNGEYHEENFSSECVFDP